MTPPPGANSSEVMRVLGGAALDDRVAYLAARLAGDPVAPLPAAGSGPADYVAEWLVFERRQRAAEAPARDDASEGEIGPPPDGPILEAVLALARRMLERLDGDPAQPLSHRGAALLAGCLVTLEVIRDGRIADELRPRVVIEVPRPRLTPAARAQNGLPVPARTGRDLLGVLLRHLATFQRGRRLKRLWTATATEGGLFDDVTLLFAALCADDVRGAASEVPVLARALRVDERGVDRLIDALRGLIGRDPQALTPERYAAWFTGADVDLRGLASVAAVRLAREGAVPRERAADWEDAARRLAGRR